MAPRRPLAQRTALGRAQLSRLRERTRGPCFAPLHPAFRLTKPTDADGHARKLRVRFWTDRPLASGRIGHGVWTDRPQASSSRARTVPACGWNARRGFGPQGTTVNVRVAGVGSVFFALSVALTAR